MHAYDDNMQCVHRSECN